MDWHRRYLQQASWTRELREYILKAAGLTDASRILEVGCGTGVILQETRDFVSTSRPEQLSLHGIDIQAAALARCRGLVPSTQLARADAEHLPYAARAFDCTLCHFLLLWLKDPLSALFEMRRVTRHRGFVAIMAEPDYGGRVDRPAELIALGRWQAQALQAQGADTGIGARVAALVRQTEMEIVESGTLAASGPADLDVDDLEAEWHVLREDLGDMISEEQLNRLEQLDHEALRRKERVLHVPTYFTLARV